MADAQPDGHTLCQMPKPHLGEQLACHGEFRGKTCSHDCGWGIRSCGFRKGSEWAMWGQIRNMGSKARSKHVISFEMP